MIKIQYVQDMKGANKFRTCNACGKSSNEDRRMVAVEFLYEDNIKGTSIVLCSKCRWELYRKI